MRITQKMLEQRVKLLNEMTGNPVEPYTKKDGKFICNVDNYHLSGAYGGVSLHKMANESGGVHDVFSCGHIPKRELYNRINAYIQALQDVKYDNVKVA